MPQLNPRRTLSAGLVIGALISVGAVWLFSALLEEVLDKEALVRWDVAANAWIHARTTPLGDHLALMITAFGSPVVTVLGIAVALVLWRQRDWLMLITWLAALGGGKIIEGVLKATVHRQRPIYATTYFHGHSWSFPSGHSMGSVLCYATLAWILTTRWPPARRHRVLVRVVAAILILGIGSTRLYLGVHFPSDVVGGFLAGTAWVAISVTSASAVMRRADAAIEAAGSAVGSQR